MIKGEQVQSKIDAVPIDESKYSIKTLQDGKRKYVEFDKPNEAIIKGNTKAAMAYYVANYLNNIVRNGKNKYVTTNDGSKLYLTSTSVAKLTTPAKDMTLEQFRRKMRAAVHIAELAKVSVPQKGIGNRINIKPDFESKHDYWEVAQDGWQYRNSYYLDTDGQYYRVQLSISIDGQIEAIYNIGNMREIEFPSKRIDGNNKGSKPSGESTKTISTSTIISNSSENSNTFEKKSLSSVEISEEITDNIKYSLRTKPAPNKTEIAYKLFNQREDGNLYPLYINPDNDSAYVKVGEWYDADEGEYSIDTKNGRKYVKAQGGLEKLAYRPGWHSGSVPFLDHIGVVGEDGRQYLPSNFVWAEVEIPSDKNYQIEANNRGTQARDKALDYIPEDGYYKYKTNSNAAADQEWYISGALKVIRLNRSLTLLENIQKNIDKPIEEKEVSNE